MKIIISERQQRLIKENSIREDLVNQIKEEGWKSTSEMVGGDENLMKILKINSPMDFLHFFDDLEVVQSEENPNLILFRYKPKHNLMVYNKKQGYIYINYYEIWSILENNFGLRYGEIQELTKRWLDEVYNLRGVITPKRQLMRVFRLDEVYNLRGVTTARDIAHAKIKVG